MDNWERALKKGNREMDAEIMREFCAGACKTILTSDAERYRPTQEMEKMNDVLHSFKGQFIGLKYWEVQHGSSPPDPHDDQLDFLFWFGLYKGGSAVINPNDVAIPTWGFKKVEEKKEEGREPEPGKKPVRNEGIPMWYNVLPLSRAVKAVEGNLCISLQTLRQFNMTLSELLDEFERTTPKKPKRTLPGLIEKKDPPDMPHRMLRSMIEMKGNPYAAELLLGDEAVEEMILKEFPVMEAQYEKILDLFEKGFVTKKDEYGGTGWIG